MKVNEPLELFILKFDINYTRCFFELHVEFAHHRNAANTVLALLGIHD